ncbi:MAG: perR [Parcubacteria group bacterium]|nr:perR [Parcubacteria group bacterium]
MKRNEEIADIVPLLREAGLRATEQRIALLKALVASTNPLSVEDLVKAGKRTFDTATAYRMLMAFSGKGLVKRIDLGQGRALFEFAGSHHHHAVCVKCHAIRDVAACLPSSLDERVRKAAGFSRIDDHALEFFGVCMRCAKTL